MLRWMLLAALCPHACNADMIYSPRSSASSLSEAGHRAGVSRHTAGMSPLDLVCLGGIVLVVWQFVEKTGHQPDASDRATLNDILVEVGLARRRRPAGDSEDSGVFGGPPQETSKTLWKELVAISGLKHDPSLAQVVCALSSNIDALNAGLVDHGMQRHEATCLCKKIRALSQGMQRQEAERSPLRAVLAAFSTASCFSASKGTRNPTVTNSGTSIGSNFRHARDTPQAAAIATE